jgi:hypothetical protein
MLLGKNSLRTRLPPLFQRGEDKLIETYVVIYRTAMCRQCFCFNEGRLKGLVRTIEEIPEQYTRTGYHPCHHSCVSLPRQLRIEPNCSRIWIAKRAVHRCRPYVGLAKPQNGPEIFLEAPRAAVLLYSCQRFLAQVQP